MNQGSALTLQEFSKLKLSYDLFAQIDCSRNESGKINFNFEFTLTDPKSLVKISTENSTSWTRQNDLWKTTCFEIFIQPVGGQSYYEFNFSPAGFWNQYFFTDYRTPQPPQESSDFSMQNINWDADKKILSGTLVAENNNKSVFFLGITAVIEEKSGEKKYLAYNHQGQKPDFHLQKSFVIRKEA